MENQHKDKQLVKLEEEYRSEIHQSSEEGWVCAVIYNEDRDHYVMVFPQEFREGWSFNDYVQDGIVPIACEVCP